jgi:hypothetical protein
MCFGRVGSSCYTSDTRRDLRLSVVQRTCLIRSRNISVFELSGINSVESYYDEGTQYPFTWLSNETLCTSSTIINLW